MDQDTDEQPTAGPSRLSPSPPNPPVEKVDPIRPARIARHKQPGIAPHRHLPKTAYGAIEYLGPVSHAGAILDLASQEEIDGCFNAPARENPLLELHLRKDKKGVPVKGYRIPTQKLLVKVVKRKRKDGNGGIFTSEVVGPVTQTVRYRSMADWHHTPNPDGPTQELLQTLTSLDYHAILEYKMPDLDETFTIPASPELGKAQDPELSHRSLLDLQSLPLYSERRLPLVYNFRSSQATTLTDYQDPYTGEIKQRYYNTGRHIGFAPVVIGHMHALGEVPKEPEAKVKTRMPKLDQALLGKMQELFVQRPVWMRHSLLAQFDADEVKTIVDSKAYIPSCAYMFGAGPYWKCYARLGFDPRQNPENRIYQRTYFYIQVARNRQPIYATPEPGEEEDDQPIVDKTSHEAWAIEQNRLVEQGLRQPRDPKREYIFDGQVIHRDRPDYQLCDIEDPLIKKYIDDPRLITDRCDARTGWYTTVGYDMIREMIKVKYIHVRDNNEPAPDSLCYDSMQTIEDSVEKEREAAALARGEDVEME